MILVLDEEQNNFDNNNKRNSVTNLEELFQQLLVLEKNSQQSNQKQPDFIKQITKTTSTNPPIKTMYNLRNLTVLPSNYSIDPNNLPTKRTINNHNNDNDIFCSKVSSGKKSPPKVRKNYYSTNALPIKTIVITALLIVLLNIRLTYQELCPKICTCDEIETTCMQSYGASSPLHTLHSDTSKITLNNNSLTQFTGLDYLSKLKYVNTAYNKISVLDFDQVKSSVLSLNTSHNNIVELKDSIVNNALASLSTSYTDKELLKALKRLDKINVVNFVLNNNYLVTIKNYTFIRWHDLQNLDLSYNTLLTLDAYSLLGLYKLEFLNLRHNQLLQVPGSALKGTTLSLTTLSYPNRPSSLKYLDLGENSFRQIESDSFAMLEKAQELYLDLCSIESIDEKAFNGLHTLNLLSLDKNLLREVPSKSFKYLALLRSLRLNSNQFSDIPIDSFNNLVNLEELQLNYGLVKELQNGVFNGLNALKRLEISHNVNLTLIEQGSFENLKHLTYINLYSNNLTTLSDNLHELSNGSFQILDLRENPLVCGCDLKWLTKWLKKFNETALSHPTTSQLPMILNSQSNNQMFDSSFINELVNLTCSGPPALKKKLIAELPDNKLECLKPDSKLNVHIGFAILFIISFILTLVCLINFCRNKKDLFFLLKENLVQNNMSIVLPYSQNLHKNLDDLKKETKLYESDYEHIDYSNCQPGQVYTLTRDGNEQVYYNGLQHSPQNNGYI